MSNTNHILENIRKQVELVGRSGHSSVWLDNVSFKIKSSHGLKAPVGSDLLGASVDVDWFIECEDQRRHVKHHDPKHSFWLKQFGCNAVPYGLTWNFAKLEETILTPEKNRQAVLINPENSCVVCYQFQETDFRVLDVTVTMRSSDVVNVLPQDFLMTDMLLTEIASDVGMSPGYLTFNIGNAHVLYEDLEYQEEFSIDSEF